MQELKFDGVSYLAGGKRVFLICGEIHYFRLAHDQWRDRLEKLKASGANCVATYIPWMFHEPQEGRFDFTNPAFDIEHFLNLCKEVGLWCFARPGPCVGSELVYGGWPAWLYEGYPQIHTRKASGEESVGWGYISFMHPDYLAKARQWYRRIIPILAKHEVSRGGAVVAAQLDNELSLLQDCNRDTMGVGSEKGRWPDFMRGRYGTLDAANEAYGLHVKSWSDIMPLECVREGTLPERRRLRDYRQCNLEMLGDYIKTLTVWAREDGLTVPVVQNSTNPVFNSEFREMAIRQGEDYILGSDHYYLIDMDCDGVPHPDAKFATKTLYSLEQLRLLGRPPTIIEFQGGCCNDFPPITASDAECCYMMSLAYGLKGWNYYIFAGGPNPPMSCVSSEPYDAQAAVGADGSIREIYGAQKRVHEFVTRHDWLAGAGRVADCHIGLVWEYGRSWGNGFGANRTADMAFTPLEAWDVMWKGMMISAACANLQPSLVDLSKDDFLSRTDIPLMCPGAAVMPADVQRRLVQFVQTGGKLFLAPLVPTLDEDFRPCTVLSDFLGKPVQKQYPFPSPIITAFGVPYVYAPGDMFAFESRPADAQTVAMEERSKKEIGFRREYPGGGSVTVLGLQWKQVQSTHWAMLTNALTACGLDRRVECSNQYVWTTLRSDGKRTMLFIINLFTGPMTARVRYRDPVGGAWVNTGEHTLPALSVWAWADGKIVYRAGENPI